MAIRDCPYCKHPNNAEAKFCVACGAVMHLAPCPHCGAVNHINVTNCYRCGGDLPAPVVKEGDAPVHHPTAEPIGTEAAATGHAEPASAPAGTPVAATPRVAPVAVAASDAESKGHPSLAVMFIILVAFIVAVLFANRHKTTVNLDSPSIKPGAAPSDAKPTTQPPALPSVPSAAPGTVPSSAQPVPPPSAQAAPAALVAPSKTEPAKKPAEAKPRSSPAPTAAKASEPKNVTPCTEAVAALGLCKPDAK
jgi:hypothetical protein